MLRCREYLRRAGSTAFQGDLIRNITASAVHAGLPVSEVRAIIDELEGDATHADILRDVDMALVVDWAQRVEATARLALGDMAEARAILATLIADAERRGLVRFAAAHRRNLAALDSTSAD